MKARTAGDAGTGLVRREAATADAHEIARLKRALARSERDLAQALVQLDARNAELSQALARQTATAEVLQAISRSPTELQPVLEAVAQRAAPLCRADGARVWLAEGDHLRAMTGYGPGYPESVHETRPLRATSVGGRAFLERRCVHVDDVVPLLDTEYPDSRELQSRYGYRTVLVVPMLREGEAIGLISLLRNDVRPFAPSEIALVQTFADQAVIAIENVRLFNETRRALEHQTATAEVLKVISESPTDVQPVFDAICERAMALSGANIGGVARFDGEWVHLVAFKGVSSEADAAMRAAFPMRPSRASTSARAILEGVPVEIVDVERDPDYQLKPQMRLAGYRSNLSVPMLRDSKAIGSITVCRPEPGTFPHHLVELLQTFANQAVIAIENVRLFNELREKGEQLELASRHKSQFLANMSHELRTPLNVIIGFTRIVMRRTQGQIEQKQAENLEKILASGQHLLALINAVLDLSKIEAGHVEVAATEVELAPVLQQCVLAIEPLVKADTVSLLAELDGALPRMWVDEEKLRQIVINLLSNAAKFTASGNIRLSVHAAGESVRIAVTDTGIGIAADKLGLIFEEFEQADASSTRLHGGTGLGLAIARRLARLMGGDVEAESVPDRGSTFTITLPLRYRAPAAA
jgi:signal transduction histidine kinase